MLSSAMILFITLATGEFLLGILVNGFIVLVNCIDWIKRKKLSPSDLILVSLAISRIGLSCTITWNGYLILTSIEVPTYIRIIDIFLILTHTSNIWFTTILNIFYFLKITNFSNPLFLWMKWRIDRMFFMLLIGPVLIYFSIGFPMTERMYYYYGRLFSGGKERNMSQDVQVKKSMFLMFHVLIGLLPLVPFILSIISLSLLILSLWRHTRQMQLNSTGFRDPSTEAHVRAMKAVSSFAVIFLLYYMSLFADYMTVEKNKLTSILSMSIMLLYPSGHSLILILWNNKLRKTALRVSALIRCCQRGSHLQALWLPLGIIWHFLGVKKKH
ncbi:taste receptor type 2 member 7-like [Petaurus breviceps papuanus]|uniref:taste receptor type 2 member 7-like n=1 Tax=Petaurus breviceps papuanus TaxID=3040969 RepID=UPI0036DB05F7